MTVKLLTEHHLEFLSLKGCIGSSESTLVQMPHVWKSRVTAQLKNLTIIKAHVSKSPAGLCDTLHVLISV